MFHTSSENDTFCTIQLFCVLTLDDFRHSSALTRTGADVQRKEEKNELALQKFLNSLLKTIIH